MQFGPAGRPFYTCKAQPPAAPLVSACSRARALPEYGLSASLLSYAKRPLLCELWNRCSVFSGGNGAMYASCMAL